MARLYANENFALQVVEHLRALGHDVVTIQERGRANDAVDDAEVLRLAAAEHRAVLTYNRRDFIRLHGQSADHAGIVACSVDDDFAGQAGRIHAALGAAPDLRGQLVRVHRPAR